MDQKTQNINASANTLAKNTTAEKQRFCSRPFEWLEIQEKKAYLCCAGWVTQKGIDISRTTVKEIWNGPQAQELRASILDGSFRYCRPECCPHMNQDGVPIWEKKGSPFQKICDISDPRLKKIIAEKKTVLNDGPLVLNCAYDHSCNLSCPSCRTEVFALKADEIGTELQFQERIFNEVKDGLEVLYVSGQGDPFASAVYRKLLRTISADDYPKMEIHLGTNALLWTRDNWDAMYKLHKNIKTTHISVDAATPQTYAVNRRGGDWNRLMKNLEFISELRRKGTLRYVTLSFVVQRNNYKEMPAFVNMVERFGFDTAYFQKFQDWGSLNDRELDLRAIQSALHPEYPQFLKILTDPILGQPNVGLYCMLKDRQQALAIQSRPGGFFFLGLKVLIRRLVNCPAWVVGKLKKRFLKRSS